MLPCFKEKFIPPYRKKNFVIRDIGKSDMLGGLRNSPSKDRPDVCFTEASKAKLWQGEVGSKFLASKPHREMLE